MGTHYLWGNTTTYLWGYFTYGDIPLLGIYHLWGDAICGGMPPPTYGDISPTGTSTSGEHGTGTSDLWGHTNYR